jgi:hypothetical protein
MSYIDFAFDPGETMTIRRVIKPPRVPNKGKGVYRMDTMLRPVLEENGWEFINQSQKDGFRSYYRSPGGVIAETFNLHASIPTDDAVMRLVEEFKRVAGGPAWPGYVSDYHAWIEPYIGADFYPHGNVYYYTWEDPDAAPKDTEWKWDMPPSLSVGVTSIWHVYLFWPYGLDKSPEWQRH